MIDQGKAHNFRRSEFVEWNYEAELFSFGKRLNENFDSQLLRVALTDSSYIEGEKARQQSLGVSTPALQMESNEALADTGRTLIIDYCQHYLHTTLFRLPEEGISALVEYLSSEQMVAQIGFNMGLKDLILTEEHPASPETVGQSFLAIVGALNASSGLTVTQQFIQDFVITQLVGKDICEIWQIEDAYDLLEDLMANSGLGKPEPRLLYQSGPNTIEALYQVGIYDNQKQYMSHGFGETVSTAIDQAARNVLKTLFHTTDSQEPLPLGKKGRNLNLRRNKNLNIEEWSLERAENVIEC